MGAGSAPLAVTWTVLVCDPARKTDVWTALDDHDVRVVMSAGTGLAAGFTSPDAALGGAVAIQQAVETRNRTADRPVPARIGLSVADAVLADGELRGRAVVEATGLCAAAHPGEILCSAALRAMVAGPADERFGATRPVEVAGETDPIWSCGFGWEPDADQPTDRGLMFRVLGPIEVVDAGRPVAVGGPKERMVLALLLARVNVTVSIDALVDGVWSGRPPRSANRTVRSYIARLRKALAPEREKGAHDGVLVTEGRGYRLQLETDQFDALTFEDLARRGADELRTGDAAAADTLREALALWSGSAYAEFSDVDAITSEARRLDERRLVALEDRIDADLAAGAGADLASEIEGLVADNPFRERLWGQLILALYRAGRQRDALAAYQRARSLLVDELGIEPGPELRRLEAAILAQDPALDVLRAEPEARPAGLPIVLEAVGPAFVGRDPELGWLHSAWADAVAGRGRFVSLLGPEGIGKTRLIAELARAVDVDGAVVLYGRCDHAHRGARALLDQALRSAGASLSRLDDHGQVDDLAAVVARFLPTWSQGRPVLVVLDDLHLADAETLEVVADLAGWCAVEPMLVVGAFRTEGPAEEATALRPGQPSAQLVLRGLDRAAVARICALYGDDEWSTDDVTWLGRLTDGVPLRVHERASEWARQRAGRRAGDAADRLTGARVRLAASRAEIADSVEGIGRLLEQRRAQLSGRDDTRVLATSELCPYKGLARFEAADAANFFGRERLVAELVARLPGADVLTVFGPSGSGKSSLLRAGVLPALAAGILPGTDRWLTVTMAPGPHPARELARQLRVPEHGMAADRLLVFVDQFEETFTLCVDDVERDEFMGRLVELVDTAGTVVVIAVRADHLGHFAAYPALAERVTSNDVLVGPMRDTELRRVIELPAQRAGVELEPGLVEVIVGDVAGRAGALPLLSTALAETWERRHDQTLTVAGYRAAGGVNGALARMAEDAYQSLPAGPRAAARRVLLRLSDAGDGDALDLRRRLPVADVVADTDTDTHTALATLVDRRLLTVDHDSVEVAHEALLREWPRLRTWLDDDVQGRRVHRRLGDAARAWAGADHDPSELYRGTRLDGAVDWATGHDPDLNDTERAFLDASRAEAEAEITDTRRRMADKARTNRRLRGLLAGVALLLVAALAAGLLFLRQRDRAEEATRVTRVRELAGESTLALDADPELGILLALEAVRTTDASGDPALPEAVAALHEAVQSSRLEIRQPADDAYLLDASPDGALLATGSYDAPETVIWDADTGQRLRALTAPVDPLTGVSDPVSGLSFAPGAALVAVSYAPGEGQQPSPAIILWEPATGAEVARLAGAAERYYSPAFSPDGRLLAVIGNREGSPGRVTVWDVASATERFSFEPAGEPGSVGFAADGRSLVVAEWAAQRAGFYSAEDGHEVAVLPTPGFEPEVAALDASGTRLALASATSGEVQVWNLDPRQLLRPIRVADVRTVDWSPDGDRLAIGTENQGPLRIVDVGSGEDVMVLRGHVAASSGVAFIGAGDRLASAGGDLRVWDVTGGGPADTGAVTPQTGIPLGYTTSPDGSELATVTRSGAALEFISTETGEPVRPPLTDLFGGIAYPEVSPDWRLVGLNTSDGHGEIRDLRSGSLVRDLPECTSPKGFSPDGSLVVLDGRVLCTSIGGAARNFDPLPGADLRSRVVDVATDEVVIDLSVAPGSSPGPGSPERWIAEAVFNPGGRFAAGRYLAVVLDQQFVEIYDVQEGELLTRLEVPGQLGLKFDPDGRWLAGRVAGGRSWVLDLAAVVDGTGADDAVVFDLPTSDGASRVAIGHDGILATSGNGDGRIRLWDVATGAVVLEFRTDRIDARAVGNGWIELSPDGSELYYTDAAGVIRRYLMDADRLVELAESRLTRQFTADECRRYLVSAECP